MTAISKLKVHQFHEHYIHSHLIKQVPFSEDFPLSEALFEFHFFLDFFQRHVKFGKKERNEILFTLNKSFKSIERGQINDRIDIEK